MGRFENILGQTVDFEFAGETFKVSGFKVKDAKLLNKLRIANEKQEEPDVEDIVELCFRVLHRADKTITMKDIEEIPIKYLEDLLKLIDKISDEKEE